MKSSQKKRIGVIRGGSSSEYDISLLSGKNVLNSLDKDLFIPVDIFIDRSGAWHMDGVTESPHGIIQFVDIVFSSLHGEFGEDGKAQSFFEETGKLYNGSNSFESKILFDKNQTKLLLKKYGVLTPAHKIIRSHSNKIDEELVDIWNRLHHPLIIKPNKGGSSLGIRLAKDFNALKNIVYVLTSEGHDVLIEEYIKGREVSVPVIEDMRGESLYTPIPLEVRHGAEFFDEKVKKDIKYQLEPMVNFNDTEKKLVQKLAKHIHKSLNLKHYSVSDFIVSKKGIYFIETNSLPGLTENSILVRSLEESGVSMKYFLTHIIEKIK